MKSRSLVILIALALFAAGGLAHADQKIKMYKWVDKDGITHYGSSIPPEYAAQSHEQIDSEGKVIQTTAAQKTPEQIAAEEKAQQLAAQQAQAAAVQQAHDKVLLDTYSSTADMERDRDSKLASIDAQINVFSGAISSLQTTLADLQSRSNELTSKNKPVPAKLQQQINAAYQQDAAQRKAAEAQTQ